MGLTIMRLLENIKAELAPIMDSVSEMESIIGFVVLIAGIIATGWQTIISTCSILFSYNIEIALMTKKERVKMNATGIVVYIIALWLFNLLCSHMATIYVANNGVILAGILLIFAGAVTLIFIMVLLFGNWFIKKLSNVHICRFIGIIFKKILLAIGAGIYKMTEGLRRTCRILMDRIKNWEKLGGIRRCYVSCCSWLMLVWKSCEKDEHKNMTVKLTFSQQLRLAGFAITTVGGILFNYILAVYANGNQNVYLLSIMVTILTIEVGTIFLNFQVAPEDSRIYYYDDTWQKYIFIYFRQDEAHCIGGDADILGDCNELFLVPYEKIEKRNLYSISKWKQNRVNIDNKRIRLQHGQNELIMNDVFDKIKNELQSKEIVSELMERADIYVKLEDKKVYYVLADGTRGDIDL